MLDACRLYESIPVPILAVEGERARFANRAFLELVGLESHELVGAPAPELLRRKFELIEHVQLKAQHPELPDRGILCADQLLLRAVGRPDQVMEVRRLPGRTELDSVLTFVPKSDDLASRRLVDAALDCAARFIHCTDEREVVATAAQALLRLGYYSNFLIADGDEVFYGPMTYPEEVHARVHEVYGRPLEGMRFPRNIVPHFDRMFEKRRGVYQASILDSIEALHGTQAAELVRPYIPNPMSVKAPIFCGKDPYGFISIQGLLTESCAPAVEVFAGFIGSGIENVRLHQRAQQQIQELQRLQKELVEQERMAVLGRAAGAISHEARNPLAVIVNTVNLLKRSGRSEAEQQLLQILEEEAQRLDHLVADLSSLSQPLDPRPGEVHVESILVPILGKIRVRCELDGVRLLVSFEACPNVVADAQLIEMAVANLLRNAVQVARPGEAVSVTLNARPGWVVLAVEDPAPRQDERPLDLLQPLSFDHAAGAALGISMVGRVAHAHGGQLWSRRSSSGGTRIELMLPIGRDDHRSAA